MNLKGEPNTPIITVRERSLTFGAGRKFATFDRSGRFLFFAEPGHAIRRGLDHRIVDSVDGPFGRVYKDFTEAEKTVLIKELYDGIRRYLEHHNHQEHASRIQEILAWTPEKLAADHDEFQKVYKPISILPPDMYSALVVQVTEGCSYNQCVFCDFYRDRPFHIKSALELQQHLTALRNFFGERLQDRSGIFLGDGNAMVVPTARLLDILKTLRAELPDVLFVDGIATFMDTFSLDRKSSEELAILRSAGMKSVYVGFETGADRLRDFLKKQGSAAEAYAAMAQLKAANYRLVVILLVGAGGEEYAEEHLRDTLAVLKELPLTKGDIIYLSPFVEPTRSDYRQNVADAGIRSLVQLDLQQQYDTFRSALLNFHPEIKVTLYSISQHLY